MRKMVLAILVVCVVSMPLFAQQVEPSTAEQVETGAGEPSVAAQPQPTAAEGAEVESESGEPAQQPAEAGEAPVGQPEVEFTPLPITELTAHDTPSDGGNSITLSWKLPPADVAKYLISFKVLRADSPGGEFREVGITAGTTTGYVDSGTEDKKDYWYKVRAVYLFQDQSFSADSEVFGPVQSRAQWFDRKKIGFGILALLVSAAIIYFIETIKAGKMPFIRKIAGMEAIDEAIGRATEMGRPILFIPGIMDMNDVQTVAAVIILGRIAKTVAEYDTKLLVPTSKSLVMTTARETVKEAYTAAGRPDAYSDDIVTYLTDDQFGYVSGVNGIMVRDKPATCLYLGAFYAESLILAETGNSIGAIQIAGTAQPAQLPFFIAACDYTLIGEELFAASAYLSMEPRQLGSLKGQDVGKAIAMFFILVGTLFATLAAFDVGWASRVVDFLMNRVFAAI